MVSKFFKKLSGSLKKDADSAPQDDAPVTAGTTPQKPSFEIGSVIAQRYRLDAQLGRGGMGTVYRACDLSGNRDVAIKIINPLEVNELALQQFSREADITTRLVHPHIVTVYETGQIETGETIPTPYIVMELINGTGLDELRGLTFLRIIDLGLQICQALDFAHSQGFIHRDLKPGNVLLEKQGFGYIAKLADFGLARPIEAANLPSESNAAGTIFYLAPEVIAGQPASVASDLYALGAMLYEMVTGRVPFSDFIDDQAILMQHLEEAPAPPSHSRQDVPPALDEIILRLLEKEPQNRFGSARDVYLALEQVAHSLETSQGNGNLPQVQAGFMADNAAVAEIVCLLESGQMVTILKDDENLPLAVGAQVMSQLPDGVWLIDLEQVTNPGLVLQAAASTLGISATPQRPLAVSLIETLRKKHLLLILTHCSHLTGACVQLIETILRTCPESRILVCNPQPLNIAAEQCYP